MTSIMRILGPCLLPLPMSKCCEGVCSIWVRVGFTSEALARELPRVLGFGAFRIVSTFAQPEEVELPQPHPLLLACGFRCYEKYHDHLRSHCDHDGCCHCCYYYTEKSKVLS